MESIKALESINQNERLYIVLLDRIDNRKLNEPMLLIHRDDQPIGAIPLTVLVDWLNLWLPQFMIPQIDNRIHRIPEF